MDITLVLQVWQLWPSRTLKEEGGLKKTTNSLTASPKNSRTKSTRNISNPSKASTTDQENMIFISAVKKKRGKGIFSTDKMVKKEFCLHGHVFIL